MRNIILARLRKIIATVELKVGQTINKGDEGIEMIQANRYVTENIIMADRTQGNDTIVKDSGVKEKIVGGKNVAAMAKAFSNDNIAQIFTKRFTQALRGNSKGDNLDLDNGTYTAYDTGHKIKKVFKLRSNVFNVKKNNTANESCFYIRAYDPENKKAKDVTIYAVCPELELENFNKLSKNNDGSYTVTNEIVSFILLDTIGQVSISLNRDAVFKTTDEFQHSDVTKWTEKELEMAENVFSTVFNPDYTNLVENSRTIRNNIYGWITKDELLANDMKRQKLDFTAVKDKFEKVRNMDENDADYEKLVKELVDWKKQDYIEKLNNLQNLLDGVMDKLTLEEIQKNPSKMEKLRKIMSPFAHRVNKNFEKVKQKLSSSRLMGWLDNVDGKTRIKTDAGYMSVDAFISALQSI